MTEVDYPVMPEPEWAKPRDKKMESTVWAVSCSLEFVLFMFVDEKTLACSFEDVTFFFLNLSQRVEWCQSKVFLSLFSHEFHVTKS